MLQMQCLSLARHSCPRHAAWDCPLPCCAVLAGHQLLLTLMARTVVVSFMQ